MLNVGDQAPDFELKDQFGRMIASKSYAGKQHLLLAFYPLDFTPT